jgi:hypothetical protein
VSEPLFTKDQIEELAARTHRSPVEFARIFLADWFPTKMPWVHRGMLALMKGRTEFLLDFGQEEWRDEVASWTPQDLEKILTNFLEEGSGRPIFTLEFVNGKPVVQIDAKRSVCIIMPRGSAKTTLVNLDNLHDLVFQEEDFFLYVSESGAHARKQLATIKDELEDNDGAPNNELIYLVFGSFKPPRQDARKWTDDYIETRKKKKVMVGAVGRGGQIRGFGKNAKRPGKIMFDDLEDEESVQSDTQRKKDSHWFFNAARPAKRKHTGRDIITGTLLHTDAILNKCIVHPEFTAVRFGAIDRQGDALWPWWMDLDAIEASRQAAASVGELSGWYLEYMSEYKDDDARIFPESKLIYVHKGLERFVAVSEALDPAISDNRKADLCAFAVAGIEAGGHKHILDYHGEVGMDTVDIIEKFFELHFKWMKHLPPENQKHGIEAIAFQRALVQMVRMKQVEYSRPHILSDGVMRPGWGPLAYFEVLPLFHGKIAKTERIKGIMKPLVYGGAVSFETKFESAGSAPGLHSQFIDFPSSKYKDGPDVCAMAIALLDPYVTLGLGDEGMADLEKDTAPPLMYSGGAP